MTKVIWLGEDTEEVSGPSYNTWNGIKFPKGVAVDVTDPHMLGKAKINQYFKVIEETKEDSHGESQTQGEEKNEDKGKAEKGYDYREKEKRDYSPVKKKVRKKKPAAEPAAPSDRVSTPDP